MRTLLVAMIAGLLLVGCKPTDTGKTPPTPAPEPTKTEKPADAPATPAPATPDAPK